MTSLHFTTLVLVLLTLVSCSAYEYDPRTDQTQNKVGVGPIYSLDKKGNLSRDTRIEQIRSRGCTDNSTDCGRAFGW